MSIRNENRPGYKKTKVGWIPEEWEVKNLVSLATDGISNGVFNDPEKVGSGYKIVNVLDLYNEPNIDAGKLALVNIAPEELKRAEVRYGDLFFTRSSLKPEGIAHCNIFLSKEKNVTFDGHVMKITPDTDKVDMLYLRNYCVSPLARMYFMKNAKQTTMTTIGQKEIGGLPVLLPPRPEQRRIATILSTWDRAIDQVRALIEAKKKLKKGLMQQLLTGRMRFPEFGKPAKNGELPEGWKQVKIGDLLEEVSRPVDFNDETFYSLISVRRNSGGAFYRETLKGSDIATKNLFVTKQGDFLISKMQVLHGAMAMTPAEFDGMHISGSYISLVPKNKVVLSIEYFNYLSQTPKMYHKAYISSHGVHIEKMTFDLDLFLNEKVVVPARKEQEKIVRTIRSIEQTIGFLEASVAHFKQQKKGLMQKLLTGEVRVHLAKDK